jgi:hypothetical protein
MILSCVGFTASAQGQLKQTAVLDLPSPGLDMAVAEKSGTVAVVFPADRVVRAYPRLLDQGTLDAPLEFRAPGTPYFLAHKQLANRGVYLVLSLSVNGVIVLDDKTLNRVAQVDIAGGRPVDLAVPASPDVPYVYYALQEGTDWLGRVNLSTMKSETVQATGRDNVDDIDISADGRFLYGRRLNVSPSGRFCWRVSEASAAGAPPEATQIVYVHDSTGAYVPDPLGQYVTGDRNLWSMDMSQELGQVQYPIKKILRSKPLMIGVQGNSAQVFSYNTFSSLATFPLPAEPAPAGARPGRPAARPETMRQENFENLRVRFEPTYEVDEQRNLLLVQRESSLTILPLSLVTIPSEPLLSLRLDGPNSLNVDQAGAWKITKLDQRVQFSLDDAPQGMKLANGSITWTPTIGQVGTHRVKLSLNAAGLTRAQEMVVSVQQRSIHLPFYPDRMEVTPDGLKAIIVANDSTRADARQRPNRNNTNGPVRSRIAVVDLAGMKVIADKVQSFQFRTMAATSSVAYVAAQDTDAIFALSLNDLSETKRVFTPASVHRLLASADRLYTQTSDNNGRLPPLYKLPEFVPIDDPFGSGDNYSRGSRMSLMETSVGIYANGVIWKPADRAAMLINPPGLFALANQNGRRLNGRESAGDSNVPPVSQWGVTAVGSNLIRLTGQSIAREREGIFQILDDVPAAISVTFANMRENAVGISLVRATLGVFDLSTGRPTQSIVLFDGATRAGDSSRGNDAGPGRLAVAGDRIVFLYGDEIYTVPVSAIDTKALTEPLHFIIKQTPQEMILTESAPLRLQGQVKGGKPPYVFEPVNVAQGVSVDSGSGAMTIDPATIQAEAIKFIIGQVGRRVPRPGASQAESYAAVLEKAAEAARGRFKAMTGVEAKGYPIVVPADLLVRDSEQQTAVLNRAVLFDVPIAAVVAVNDAQVAEEKQRNEQRQESIRQQQAATSRPADADVESLQRRISDLERRNAELEGQVKLMKEMLSQQQAQ